MASGVQLDTDLIEREKEIQDWLSYWFSPEMCAVRARARVDGLAMAIRRNENHLDVLLTVAKTEKSTLHWELVKQTYEYFQQSPRLPMPKILRKWADEVTRGRRIPPKQRKGRPPRYNEDCEVLHMMPILRNNFGLTQDAVKGLLKTARKTNATVPSFSRFIQARKKAQELHNRNWNLIALREESGNPIDRIPDLNLLNVMQLLLNKGLTPEQAATELQADTKIDSSTILSRFHFLSGEKNPKGS